MRLGEREKSNAYKDVKRRLQVLASVHQPLHFESERFKRRFDRRLARVEYNSPTRAEFAQPQPDGFSHPPFHTIAHHGLSERARHSETDFGTIVRSCEAECSEVGTGKPESLVIHFAEVASAEDPLGFGKRESGLGDADDLFGRANSALVADGQFVAALGTSASEHCAAILCFHALAETMRFGPFAVIRLKCSLWHRSIFLESRSNPRSGASIAWT